MKAIEVREARIAQLQSDIDALQQVAGPGCDDGHHSQGHP